MNDIKLVQILNARNYLMEKFKCMRFLDPLVLDDVVEQFTAICVLHNQVQLLGCFDDFVELNDVGVSDHLQNVDFAGNSLYVVDILDFVLLENFYRNLQPISRMVNLHAR